MSGWRDRWLGDRDRLGWWTLPVFVMVGLAGAVLAGALAAVYFGQQVDALEDETRDARQAAADAAAEVDQAREQALDEIDDRVAGVREALTRELPFEDVPASGIVALRVGGGDTARVGAGFAVALEGGAAFFATTHGVVADPDAPGGVAERVEVVTPAGTFAGTVHSWDADRDLAVVRAEVGEVVVPRWRRDDAPLAVGERVVAASVSPTLNGLQVTGQVVHADTTVLVTDLPPLPLLEGAPVVDTAGHVVAVQSSRYAPFGPAAGGRQSAVPVRLLCETMLRNCEALQAPADDG